MERLRKIKLHLCPNYEEGDSIAFLKELNGVTKLTASLIIPVGAYYTYCTLLKIPPPEIVTFLIHMYSQGVGLYALRKMHNQLKENLGVSRTLARSYQLLSFFGSGMYTASFIGSLNTTIGKSNFISNLLHTIAYGYFLYLTILYNYEVPDPRDKRIIRGSVHWKSLIGYIIVMVGTMYIWIRDSQASISTGDRYTLLAMLGFILTSFGILRGGFKAATTSIPGMLHRKFIVHYSKVSFLIVISPFAAVAPLACATILNTLIKMPQFSVSPIMRTYVVGYIAVSYCLVIIAYLALKEERVKSSKTPFEKPQLF